MLVATVNFTFRDAKGKTSVTKIRVPSQGLSFSTLIDFAEAAGQILKNLSGAQLVDISISVGLDLSGADLKAVATQFADVFNKAFIVARDTLSNLFGRFSIPTYDETNNLANSDVLDPADAQVLALMTLIEDGLDDGGIAILPVTVRDGNLDEVVSATEKFRKS